MVINKIKVTVLGVCATKGLEGSGTPSGTTLPSKGQVFWQTIFVASARPRRPFNQASGAVTELKGRPALRYKWIVRKNASVACFSPAQSARQTLITRPAILARVCGGDSGPARGTSVPDVGICKRVLSCRFLDISGGHNSGAGPVTEIGSHSVPK